MLGTSFGHMCERVLGPSLGRLFASSLSSFISFWGVCLDPPSEGSLPAEWRPWPQLSRILGHSKTQKVNSRLHERACSGTQLFVVTVIVVLYFFALTDLAKTAK